MSETSYVHFRDILPELLAEGRGFVTSSDLLERIEALTRRRRVTLIDGPISGMLSWQGTLKALAHLMRRHGYPPVKSTGGERGYRL
jgi:hypothetical protein